MNDDEGFAQYCEKHDVRPLKSKLKIFNNNNSRQPVVAVSTVENIHLNIATDIIAPINYCDNGQNVLLRQLASSSCSVDIVLDFHGCTVNDALSKLQYNINGHPFRIIMQLIHGKGLNSKGNKPILKNAIHNYLLRQSRLLAYTIAHEKLGGSGVTNCCFRAQK